MPPAPWFGKPGFLGFPARWVYAPAMTQTLPDAKKKLFIKTYGCQMNERDSEQVARMFVEGGYTVTPTEKDADAELINT